MRSSGLLLSTSSIPSFKISLCTLVDRTRYCQFWQQPKAIFSVEHCTPPSEVIASTCPLITKTGCSHGRGGSQAPTRPQDALSVCIMVGHYASFLLGFCFCFYSTSCGHHEWSSLTLNAAAAGVSSSMQVAFQAVQGWQVQCQVTVFLLH